MRERKTQTMRITTMSIVYLSVALTNRRVASRGNDSIELAATTIDKAHQVTSMLPSLENDKKKCSLFYLIYLFIDSYTIFV